MKPSAVIDTRVIYCGDNLDQLRKLLIAIEKHDLDDAMDLFGDLEEGLEKLESMLTTRWRKIAGLSRELGTSNKLT